MTQLVSSQNIAGQAAGGVLGLGMQFSGTFVEFEGQRAVQIQMIIPLTVLLKLFVAFVGVVLAVLWVRRRICLLCQNDQIDQSCQFGQDDVLAPPRPSPPPPPPQVESPPPPPPPPQVEVQYIYPAHLYLTKTGKNVFHTNKLCRYCLDPETQRTKETIKVLDRCQFC